MRVVAAFLVNTLCNFAIGLLVAKFLGPEEFGRFALTLAVGGALQMLLFEWIRQSAIRFYSQRSRVDQPQLRSTLDVSFLAIAAVVSVGVCLAMAAGLDFHMPNSLVGLAVAASIVNGLFDYNTAMVRARFDDVLYGRLVLTKNLVALVCTAGGALVFRSATMALVGVCISMAGSLVAFRASLADANASPRLAQRGNGRVFFGYAAPIVVANLLYILLPLLNRALVARYYGFAETGQFSLAFDIGSRVTNSIGSALDVVLFQLAVRAAETHGDTHGHQQVARNMSAVFAILTPACAGVWLILPSLEQLVVPVEYRGPFRSYLSVLLLGQFLFGLINYAINPVFQIAKRTMPLIIAAVVGGLADVALILWLPREASSLALAYSGAMAAGFVALIGLARAYGGSFPALRDLVAASAGVATMALALVPLRDHAPGLLTLLEQMLAGVIIYGLFVFAFDIAGLRELCFGVARRLRARFA